jgi:hypothetical protein
LVTAGPGHEVACLLTTADSPPKTSGYGATPAAPVPADPSTGTN